MGKKIKWSHFKRDFKESIIRIFSVGKKYNGNKHYILINSMDALGDNLVKLKSIEYIATIYGKENIYILCKDKWADIYRKMGYNVLVDRYKGLFERIKLYKKINTLPFEKVIYFNHSGERISENLIRCKNKIVFPGSEKGKYILESHREFLEKYFNKKISVDELKGDVGRYYKDGEKKDIITIGIGSASKDKTMCVKKAKEMIEYIVKRFPNKKIVLLGSGLKQKIYTEKLLEDGLERKVENLVDKLTLEEVLKYVANSDMFVGYDSGLTNASFVFGVKYICFFWNNDCVWEHKFKNCITLRGEGIENIEDRDGYGTTIVNTITVEQLESAINKLYN